VRTDREHSTPRTFSSCSVGLAVLPAAAEVDDWSAAVPADAAAAVKEAGIRCVYMASSTPSAARRSSGPSYSTLICVGESCGGRALQPRSTSSSAAEDKK